MKVIAKCLFVSPIYGNVTEGSVLVVSDADAKHFIELGLVKMAQEVEEKADNVEQDVDVVPDQPKESVKKAANKK